MAGLGETLVSPRPPLAIRPWCERRIPGSHSVTTLEHHSSTGRPTFPTRTIKTAEARFNTCSTAHAHAPKINVQVHARLQCNNSLFNKWPEMPDANRRKQQRNLKCSCQSIDASGVSAMWGSNCLRSYECQGCLSHRERLTDRNEDWR
jgi:hypothetical protein